MIDSLKAFPQPKLVIYSDRPQSISEHLEFSGKEGVSYSVGDAIVLGQAIAGVSA